MKKQHILLISQNFYPEIGSAGNRMKNIFELLKEENYIVTVLTTQPLYPNRKIYSEPKFWHDEPLNTSDDVQRISVRNKRYSFSIINRLLFYIEVAVKMLFFVLFDRKKYDVIFVSSPPIFIGFVGFFAKYRYKAKLILDIRDLWPESLKGVGVFSHRFIINVFSKLEKLLYKRSDHIFVNSVGFIDYISNKAKINKGLIKFMPNSARKIELIKSINSKSNQQGFGVIYTGNIGLAQDVEFLKELALRLYQNNIRFSIVGYGLKRRELSEFVKNKELTNVNFFNPMTRKECLKLNAMHDIGVLSLNQKEVFDTVLPGKLIDYMLTSLPVVASVSGASKKLIETNNIGFVSESRNPDDILRYILDLKNKPEMLSEMKQNCTRIIKSMFLWENNIETLLEILGSEDRQETSIEENAKSVR